MVNPAPATIKTTVFIENGGFSNFLSIFLRCHAVGKANLAPPTRRRPVDEATPIPGKVPMVGLVGIRKGRQNHYKRNFQAKEVLFL